jgi:Zn-dependent protease with chaperone function
MAMNFFEHQDQARRQTRTLVILFVLAVIAILLSVNGAAAVIWSWTHPLRFDDSGALAARTWPAGLFVVCTLLPLALISGGTLYQMFMLRDGGEAVAKMAGGRQVELASREAHERRLLNVVEEMALASGVACPKVYVLDSEESINAFAAGYNPNEAVVAVTRGTLERLTRDELQGVVAHEFSHILNGDMRLNVKLIGVLFGIQMIAGMGQNLLYVGSRMWGSRSRDEKGPPIQLVVLAIGASLFVIGYIGIFFGRLIKAAVSRQREFLADASAVQFTRNPDSIGGALRKIGGFARDGGPGSGISNPNAEQLSHLFLGAVRPRLLSGLYATHPPIDERLQRIYGKDVTLLAAPELSASEADQGSAPIGANVAGFAATGSDVGSAAATSAASQASTLAFGHHAAPQQRLAPEIAQALREPAGACALAWATLLGRDAERAAQMALLQADAPQQAALTVELADQLDRMPASARLPLLDLAMPALRQLSLAERAAFLQTVERLVAADSRVTLAEFVVQTVLTRRLAATAGRATPVRFNDLAALSTDCAILLSLVAHVSAEAGTENALDVFLRGAAQAPQVRLTAASLRAPQAIAFEPVKSALDHTNQLAPLQKPFLIKMLLAAAMPGTSLSIELADLLRAICSALDAPIPPAVSATYTTLA